MNNFQPGVMIVIIGGILLLVIAFAWSAHTEFNRELHRFARSWRGHVERSHAFAHPRITLKLGESPAVLEYSGGGDDGVRTHLQISLYDVRVRLELRPQGLAQRLGKYLGMQDIEIGSPAFDSAFIIQGSDERQIRECLTPAVQESVLKVAKCGKHGRFDLHLQLGSGSLRITKHEHITSAAELSNFVRCCFELLVQLQKPLSAGIEFVESTRQSTAALQETECQVCGDPLLEKVVHCMKCKTPHHLDCWQYFGSCSVYGCGQKRYIVFRK